MEKNNNFDLQMFASYFDRPTEERTEEKTKEILDQVKELPKDERLEYLLISLIVAIKDQTDAIVFLAFSGRFN